MLDWLAAVADLHRVETLDRVETLAVVGRGAGPAGLRGWTGLASVETLDRLADLHQVETLASVETLA